MRVHTGTITNVMNDENGFRIRYKAGENQHILDDVGIEKRETAQSDFIAASVGKSIEVTTDNQNKVQTISIAGMTVLSR